MRKELDSRDGYSHMREITAKDKIPATVLRYKKYGDAV